MCNAWNHDPSCDCGWGGINYNTGFNISSFSNRITSSKTGHKTSSSSNNEEPKTYLAKCWWCGQEVFHHTNGYGDFVMFDSLGLPWKIHKCWQEYWRSESIRRRIIQRIYSNIKQVKRWIIKNIARTIPQAKVGKLNIYGVKESMVALKMGLSIEDLRRFYGDVYTVTDSGDMIFPSPLQKKPNQRKNIICRNCGERVKKNYFRRHLKDDCTGRRLISW